MRVSRGYNSPASVFGDPAKVAKVQEVLNQIVAVPCSIRIEWLDDATEAANAASKSPVAAALGQQRQQRAELQQIPLVKKAAEVLGAQIVKYDEGFGSAAKAVAADPDESPEEA